MPRPLPILLRELHGSCVAVSVDLGSTISVIRGQATYEHADQGALLRVQAPEADGGMEILFHEQDWNGSIEVDSTLGCDYRIELSVAGIPLET